MIIESTFEIIIEKAKSCTYSSINYIDYEDCKNADILYDHEDIILLQDSTQTPHMLYFATNHFETLLTFIATLSGQFRLHFVPRQYVAQLEQLGFIEWGEYTDYWNENLTDTANRLNHHDQIEFLNENECQEVSIVSQKCRLQSRGFEGETEAWFTAWLSKNKVIVVRKDSAIVGFCCFSIYNEGTTLWIREIAVDPQFQGQGCGKKLMEQAIQYGAANGAVKGFLAADILNKHAISMYKKYNFHTKGSDSELQMIRTF
jgi:ribosomal protein S18 acetylase RimI-like enzyme